MHPEQVAVTKFGMCIMHRNPQKAEATDPQRHWLNCLEFVYNTKEFKLKRSFALCLPYGWSWCHWISQEFSDGDFAIHMLSASSIGKEELRLLGQAVLRARYFSFYNN